MRAYEIHAVGQADGLRRGERKTPVPGPGEVLVRVRAASLNFRDLFILEHGLGANQKLPVVPLSDGAGEVEAVGRDVTAFRPGDRVAGSFFQTWEDGRFDLSYHAAELGGPTDGMLAEYVVLAETGVVTVPDHLTFEEAATLPCAGVTAWTALVDHGRLAAGDTVLAIGTGGVSVFALQFAAALGAKVVVTSSSDEKLDRARLLGAWAGVNYKTTPDWDGEVLRLTDGRGVDHVIEVGGPGTLERSFNSVAAGGHVALVGALTGFGGGGPSLMPLIYRRATASGIYVGSRADFRRLTAFLTEHRLRPVVDRVFDFDDAPAAYGHLKSGSHFGKVVVRV